MSHSRSLASSLFICSLALGACSTSADRPATGHAGTTGTAGTTSAAGTAGVTGAAGDSPPTGAAGDRGGAGTAAAGTSGGAGTSASGDAGTSADASAPDAKPDATPDLADATPSGCPYKLCEDFEGVAPGATGSPWAIDLDKKGTVLETVGDKGHAGTHALHVKMSAMAGVFGYITETKTLAETGASFWGRVFIWYAVDVPGVHIVNVAVDGKTGTTSEQVRIVNVIGSHIATNRRSDDMGKGSNVGPPSGKWGCYEWHITPTSLDVYLDGAELPISETWTEPTISLLRLGFERFAAGAAGDIWMDDIAINDSQIGCH
jgi:hypothetical protein